MQPDISAQRMTVRTFALEAVCALAGAVFLIVWALTTIDVDPLDRIGQVSALSAQHLAFAGVAAVAVGLLVLARRTSRRHLIEGVACALLAGAASGFVTGAMLAALDGTPLWLGGYSGDIGTVTRWAIDLQQGRGLEVTYPPGSIVGLALTSAVTGLEPVYAAKVFFAAATALVGPLGYLAWRFLTRPVLALALGVVAALPFVDPYKPTGNSMLPMVVVGVVLLVRLVRRAPQMTTRQGVVRGALLGLAMGLIFLTYTGWFLWLAPTAIVLVVALLPWRAPRDVRRQAWLRVATVVGVCGGVFLAVAAVHLVPLLRAPAIVDSFFYFDTEVDPGYYLMWRTGLPGRPGEWPPPGELGGVGLFAIVVALVVGIGLSLWRYLEREARLLGGRAVDGVLSATDLASLRTTAAYRDVLLVALGGMAAAWVWRHRLAAQVYETQNVALWPRTSLVLTYLALVIAVIVAAWAAQALLGLVERRTVRSGGYASLAALVTCALLLAAGSSAMSDRYMPSTESRSLGTLAQKAHSVQLPDGTCPQRAPQGECAEMTDKQREYFAQQ